MSESSAWPIEREAQPREAVFLRAALWLRRNALAILAVCSVGTALAYCQMDCRVRPAWWGQRNGVNHTLRWGWPLSCLEQKFFERPDSASFIYLLSSPTNSVAWLPTEASLDAAVVIVILAATGFACHRFRRSGFQFHLKSLFLVTAVTACVLYGYLHEAKVCQAWDRLCGADDWPEYSTLHKVPVYVVVPVLFGLACVGVELSRLAAGVVRRCWSR